MKYWLRKWLWASRGLGARVDKNAEKSSVAVQRKRTPSNIIGISQTKQQFVVTHTIRQTEISALLDSLGTTSPSVKLWYPPPQKKISYFRSSITCSRDGILRTCQVFYLSPVTSWIGGLRQMAATRATCWMSILLEKSTQSSEEIYTADQNKWYLNDNHRHQNGYYPYPARHQEWSAFVCQRCRYRQRDLYSHCLLSLANGIAFAQVVTFLPTAPIHYVINDHPMIRVPISPTENSLWCQSCY